jgi:ABC-type nitrate/sulfonate/bicarbonate transport system substrate-binding protein
VRAFVRGAEFVKEQPDRAAEIASPYIGIHSRFIREALRRNLPRVDAIRNRGAIDRILALMVRLGYVDRIPSGFTDLSFLDAVQSAPIGTPHGESA